MAQAKRLIETEQHGIGSASGLKTPPKRLAVNPVELADLAQAKAIEQGLGFKCDAQGRDGKGRKPVCLLTIPKDCAGA